MASSNKTKNYALNKWLGTDFPSRTDFVADNEIIDSELFSHAANGQMHLTQEEKDKLDTPYSIGTYVGNGTSSRTIQLPFVPGVLIIFPITRPLLRSDFNTATRENNMAFATQQGSSWGVSLSGGVLSVNQSTVSELGSEFKYFNFTGAVYMYIMFK